MICFTGLTFEVAEGGFLDIDFSIVGPSGETIETGERVSNGKYTFAATIGGVYSYCFSNKMSTMTPKLLMFSMDVGESQPNLAQDAEANGNFANHPSSLLGFAFIMLPSTGSNHTKLEEMIKELSSALRTVKHEQDYMGVRERVHRQINESTNSRVVMWSFFEAFVLVSMTIGQIYYLKRFFEVRRVV